MRVIKRSDVPTEHCWHAVRMSAHKRTNQQLIALYFFVWRENNADLVVVAVFCFLSFVARFKRIRD